MNEQKEQLRRKCQAKKEEDAATLAEEGNVLMDNMDYREGLHNPLGVRA